MSGEISIHELEDLKDMPVLEGELEWVLSVIDGSVKTEDGHTRANDVQEHNDKMLKS